MSNNSIACSLSRRLRSLRGDHGLCADRERPDREMVAGHRDAREPGHAEPRSGAMTSMPELKVAAIDFWT
jgi:hypothetical protein